MCKQGEKLIRLDFGMRVGRHQLVFTTPMSGTFLPSGSDHYWFLTKNFRRVSHFFRTKKSQFPFPKVKIKNYRFANINKTNTKEGVEVEKPDENPASIFSKSISSIIHLGIHCNFSEDASNLQNIDLKLTTF